MLQKTFSILLVATLAMFAGCTLEMAESEKTSDKPAKEKKDKKGIFGKTTQDIGKFDPNAGHTISDGEMGQATPGLAGLQAYGSTVQKVAVMAVQQRVEQYNATHGKYPNYDEFMNQIVKDPQAPLKLPVLPGKRKYYYDEANHALVVVEPKS